MKTGSKVLLSISGAVLLVAGSVAGTLAYLTSRADVVNTFTIGKVEIKLDEAAVDADGKADPTKDRTEDGNEYHLVPGMTYDKDPMITVAKDSEEAYVRMMLTVHKASVVQDIIDQDDTLTDYADLFTGWDPDVWEYYIFSEDKTADTITFEFRYADKVSGVNGEKELEPLFTKLIAPSSITGEQMELLYSNDGDDENDFKIVVQGHAIQSAGFESAAAAWTAFDAQNAEASE